MGSLTSAMAPLEGYEIVECTHEWVQPAHGEGYYVEPPHRVVVFYGGRPGYAAIWPIQMGAAAIATAYRMGFRRWRYGTCGVGATNVGWDAEDDERASHSTWP